MTSFKYLDRGKMSLAVLLPGWATDHRVFSRLDTEYNYLVPDVVDINDFNEVLAGNLEWSKATIVGWSLGGVLGAHFMARYPDLVRNAVFIGIRDGYPADMITLMKKYLQEDSRTYLNGFFRKCFRGSDPDDADWFNRTLKDDYVGNTDMSMLLDQLDFLRDEPFPIDPLKGCADKIKFVHGIEDALVDVKEADILASKIPGAGIHRLEGAGHPAFMHADFRRIV